ncbi:MAG: DNA-directed RNA polymerase subunit omega [Planctomycetes bacterium]|nr:DNA-directed RNA polymerase subunit omega [Planctomycetota bacterium]|tara:strand:- start:197 stop:577 length:381 start_codon:yes stop_codon:yes gene_type:complete
MLDIDLEEALVEKVGGKFALTSLMQKRMVELNRGARPLVEPEDSEDLRHLVCREILEEKIKLAPREEIEATTEEEPTFTEPVATTTAEPAAETEEKEPSEEIYGSDIKRIKEQRIKELAELLNPKK